MKKVFLFLMILAVAGLAEASSVILDFQKVQIRNLQFTDGDEVKLAVIDGEKVVGTLAPNSYVFEGKGLMPSEVDLFLPRGNNYLFHLADVDACCALFNAEEMLLVHNGTVRVYGKDADRVFSAECKGGKMTVSDPCIQLVNAENQGILRLEEDGFKLNTACGLTEKTETEPDALDKALSRTNLKSENPTRISQAVSELVNEGTRYF